MIYTLSYIKNYLLNSTFEITTDMTLNDYILTNISTEDMDKIEIGMRIIHEKLFPGTKIIDKYTDSVKISLRAMDTLSGETCYIGNGLDIAFKEIEIHDNVTLERWKYLDDVEGLMNQFPQIEIIGDEIETEYLERNAPDLRAFDYDWVILRIMHTGNDRKEVKNWILYCREAIKRMINYDNTFGGEFESIQLYLAPLGELYQLKETGTFLQKIEQSIVFKKIAI